MSTTISLGRGRRIRTRDPRFWRPVLYQLSYTPVCDSLATLIIITYLFSNCNTFLKKTFGKTIVLVSAVKNSPKAKNSLTFFALYDIILIGSFQNLPLFFMSEEIFYGQSHQNPSSSPLRNGSARNRRDRALWLGWGRSGLSDPASEF